MTAFDNIKTNNWPATSNEFEDFLALKLPLNDQASLTESLPVAVGSQELLPKKTLTNNNVLSAETGLVYSANSSGGTLYNNGSWAQAFDGSLTTGPFTYSTTSNTLTLPPGVTWSNKIRVYALRYGGVFEINGTSVISGMNSTPSWHNLTTTLGSSGTLTTIEIGDVGTNYVKLFAVELDDTILVNPLGGIKKHYDNNAYFNGSSSQLYHAPDKNFNLGTDDFCIECWFKKDNLTATGYLFQLGLEVFYTNNIEISVGTSGQARFFLYGDGTNADGGESSNNVVTPGTWHHMACTRQGTTFRGFIDGTEQVTWTKAANWNVGSSTESHNSPTIGARTNGSRNAMHLWFGGSIQDFRLYKGVAKYTSNFTPPGAILG